MRLSRLFLFLSLIGLGSVFTQQVSANPPAFFAAVERMVENSPSYRATMIEIESQKSTAQSGLYSHYPSLNGSVSHSLSGMRADGGQSSQASSLGLSLFMPVYRFGADQAAVDQAQRSLLASESAARRVRVETEKEMSTLLLEHIKLEKQVAIEERLYVSRTAVLEKAERLFKRGLLPAEELDQLRVDVGMADIRLGEMRTLARQVRQKSELALGGSLTGVSWAWEMRQLDKLETWNADGALLRLAKVPLEEAVFAVQKAEADIIAARSAMLPSIGLNASVNKMLAHRPVSAVQPETWSVGVSAGVPIFARFENAGRHDAALLMLSAAKLKLYEKELEVRQQVSKFAATIRDRITATRQRKSFLDRARSNLTKARERFLAGRISSNTLSSDENRVSEMEQSLIGNEAALQQDVVQLCAVFRIAMSDCLTKVISTAP